MKKFTALIALIIICTGCVGLNPYSASRLGEKAELTQLAIAAALTKSPQKRTTQEKLLFNERCMEAKLQYDQALEMQDTRLIDKQKAAMETFCLI
ncbi:hypothetical protein [Colwellia sp. MEBiC06753]